MEHVDLAQVTIATDKTSLVVGWKCSAECTVQFRDYLPPGRRPLWCYGTQVETGGDKGGKEKKRLFLYVCYLRSRLEPSPQGDTTGGRVVLSLSTHDLRQA